jgi:hypothetical protein
VLSDTKENVPLFIVYAQLTGAGVTIAILSASDTPAQEKSVPTSYIEYIEVFNEKKAAELLPINRPTHTIELKEGATPL